MDFLERFEGTLYISDDPIDLRSSQRFQEWLSDEWDELRADSGL